MNRIVDESNLSPVTTAPFAKHEMDAQPQLLTPCQFVVERLRSQARRRPATWRKFRQAADEPSGHVSEPIHYRLPCKL